MKTTLEIPDAVFRRAKSKAAQLGISLREFVTQAVEEKLKTPVAWGEKSWMKHVGKLKHLRKESHHIEKLIEDRFEQVEPETWE